MEHSVSKQCLSVETLIRYQMPRFAASDLGLYSLPMSHKKDARLIWVNVFLRPPSGGGGFCAPLK